MIRGLVGRLTLRASAILLLILFGLILITFSGKNSLVKAYGFSLYAGNVGIGESAPTDTTVPIISITNPFGSEIVSGNVLYTASAFDNVGVTRVEFYVDSGLMGIGMSAPYLTNWSTTSYSNALHNLFAKAFDAAGNVGTSSSISVRVDNLAPVVSVTSPADGTSVSGMVSISANASDDVGVDRVEFYVDNVLIGIGSTSPYTANWDTSTQPVNSSHTIFAKAFDVVGNQTQSLTVNVTIADTVSPVASITAPSEGALIRGQVQINASASDNVAVTKVEFYSDSNLIGVSKSSPFSILWNTTFETSAQHNLTVKAYDSAGNTAASLPVNVTVDNFVPSTSITTPTNQALVSGIVNIGASAFDNVGVTRVEFYVDSGLVGADNSAPYSTSWNTTGYIHNSVHTITAWAYDGAGNQAISSAVLVTVLDITSPSVNITSPTNEGTVPKGSTVAINANASDISGISKVEFRVNGTLKCSDITSPYSCNWKVPGRKNVIYKLEAKAFDIAGNIATHTVTVTSR